MKPGVFLILLILLSSQLLSAVPDSISSRKYNRQAWFVRIYKGQKGVERHEIKWEFDQYMSKQDFQNAVDFLTDKLSGLDSLENDYRMHTTGYIHGLRGYAQYHLMHYEAAMSDMNRAIELVPKWSFGYYLRGLIHYQLRDLKAAIDDYTQAIDRKHKHKRKVDINYYIARGDAYWNQGEIENAMADFTKCIKLNPGWAYPYLRRGSARRNLQDQQGAKADFEKAIALDPHLIGGYQVLGMFYYGQKDNDAAIEVIMNGLHHNPDSPVLYEMAGSFYLEKGDNTQAITYFTKCLEMFSDDSKDMTRLQALIGISVTYYIKDDKETSRKYFDQANQVLLVLNNGTKGLEEFEKYCLGLMEKETEILSRMVEEFNNPYL